MRILDAAVGPFERVVWAIDDDSGLRAIYKGQTTIEEVVRETVLEDE